MRAPLAQPSKVGQAPCSAGPHPPSKSYQLWRSAKLVELSEGRRRLAAVRRQSPSKGAIANTPNSAAATRSAPRSAAHAAQTVEVDLWMAPGTQSDTVRTRAHILQR